MRALLWLLLIAPWLIAQSAWSASAPLPVGDTPTTARTAAGEFISWREHIIDERTDNGEPLTGGDGLVMADLDGDGFDDIVSVHESDTEYDGTPDGYVRAAFGSADPKRWHNITLASGTDAAAPEDAAIADVNGDGFPDVIVASELAHLLYLQNPGKDATRTKPWPHLIPTLTTSRGSFIRVFFADFDGDGRPEVTAANKGEQNPNPATKVKTAISVFAINGDPLKVASWTEHELGRYIVPQNAEPVDIDGDGDLDVIGGSRGEGRLIVFENQSQRGKLKFIERAVNISDGVRAAGFNLAYADLNGDGRLDIVAATPAGLGWIEQPPTLDAAWRPHHIGTFDPDAMTGFAIADIDGDGALDVMAGSYSRGSRSEDAASADQPLGRIGWFQNPGANAAQWQRHDVSRRARGMFDKFIARDVDGDGDVDFLGTRGNSDPYDGVFWIEQVRGSKPTAAFTRARKQDSAEMPLPNTSR